MLASPSRPAVTKSGLTCCVTHFVGVVKKAQKWRFREGEMALFTLLPVNKALAALTQK
jgi:hypothetical protein